MAVDELFRSKQSEDPQAENRKPTLLYSQAMAHGVLKTEEVEVETYFFSTTQGE